MAKKAIGPLLESLYISAVLSLLGEEYERHSSQIPASVISGTEVARKGEICWYSLIACIAWPETQAETDEWWDVL